MFHVDVHNKEAVLTEFHRLVDSVTGDSDLMYEAKRYSDACRRKHHKVMKQALSWVTEAFDGAGVRTIIQSSYSADVYVDDPGNIDVDLVVPVDRLPTVWPMTCSTLGMTSEGASLSSYDDFMKAVAVLSGLRFIFKETRNADLDAYRHHVFIADYRGIIIEVKIREWARYKENLYRVHAYLDALPENVRVAWRYIRSRVINAPRDISKGIKFLWYMVGAVGAEIDMKDYPLNIFYEVTEAAE